MLRKLFVAIALATAAINAAPQDSQPRLPQTVVMYATAWCPYCAKARDYFARTGTAYVEHDIEKSTLTTCQYFGYASKRF